MELGQLVAHNHVIVSCILSNFGWRKLNECASVCRIWADCARRLRAEASRAMDYQHFYMDSISGYHMSRELRSPPALALFFTEDVFTECYFSCNRFPDALCPDAKQCKKKHYAFPHAFQYCDNSTAVIGCSSNAGVYFMENSRFLRPSMSGCFLPKIDGIEYQIVEVKFSSSSSAKEILNIFETRDVKCLLVFVAGRECEKQEPYLKRILKKAFPSQDPPFAIGGGIIDNIYFNARYDGLIATREKLTLVFMMTSKNCSPVEFDCHSIILSQFFKTESSIEQATDRMSKLIPRRRHSLAIKFSCYARTKCNVLEADIFKKYFPSTVLVGCGVGGEVGIQHLSVVDSDSSESSSKKARSSNELFHSYSTILIVMQWGKLI